MSAPPSANTAVNCIFSINTGRSGSGYLAEILSESDNCVSHHEADPSGFGKPLSEFQLGREGLMNDISLQKVRAIADTNRNGLIYAESSHCFVKGFGWKLMEKMEENRVGIVVLKRDRKKIVDSFMRIQSLPLSKAGPRFMITPEKKHPCVTPPRFLFSGKYGYYLALYISYGIRLYEKTLYKIGLREKKKVALKRYQRRLTEWYVDEMNALETQFRTRFPNAVYVEADIADLNNPVFVSDMCETFKIVPSKEQKDKIGIPLNLKI